MSVTFLFSGTSPVVYPGRRAPREKATERERNKTIRYHTARSSRRAPQHCSPYKRPSRSRVTGIRRKTRREEPSSSSPFGASHRIDARLGLSRFGSLLFFFSSLIFTAPLFYLFLLLRTAVEKREEQEQ